MTRTDSCGVKQPIKLLSQFQLIDYWVFYTVLATTCPLYATVQYNQVHYKRLPNVTVTTKRDKQSILYLPCVVLEVVISHAQAEFIATWEIVNR